MEKTITFSKVRLDLFRYFKECREDESDDFFSGEHTPEELDKTFRWMIECKYLTTCGSLKYKLTPLGDSLLTKLEEAAEQQKKLAQEPLVKIIAKSVTQRAETMTDTEIVSKLISIMNVGQHHRFIDEWRKIPGIPTDDSGKMWTKDAKRVHLLMTGKKIIRDVRIENNDVIVELRDRGTKLKNEGGLKVDISKITGGIFKFSKAVWIFLIGFFTIFSGAVIFYDRVLKGDTSEPPKTQTQTDSTTIKEPQEHLIIEDTSKRKSAADSLDKK